MEQLELTLERTLPIWWAFLWRAFLVGFLAGFVLGFFAGVILGAAGAPQLGGPVGALLGFLAYFPVSLWAMKAALSKSYSNYAVALVKR